MKKFILFLLIALLTTSYIYGATSTLSINDTYRFGKSFNYQANQNLWTGALDEMQRTEDYNKLYDINTIYFKYGTAPTMWWSSFDTPTFGFSKSLPFGVGILLLQYTDESTDGDNDDDVHIINSSENSVTEIKTDTDLNVNRLIKAGIGMGFMEMVGVNYILELLENKTEDKYTTTTSDRSNSLSWITRTEDVSLLTNSSTFIHTLEGSLKLGNLKTILQLQIASVNGNEENNKFENIIKDITYSGKTINSTNNISTGRNAGNSAAGFNADDLSYTFFQADAEIKYALPPIDAQLVLELIYATRSIGDDNDKYITEEINTTYNTNTENASAYSSALTTVKYSKNNDTAMGIILKFKQQYKIFDKVKLGIYPRYGITIKKLDYDIEQSKTQIVKNDNNSNGTFNDPGEITTTVLSGDIDNIQIEEINHEIKLPIGMEIQATKAFTLRFGTMLKYSINSQSKQETETQNYTHSATTTTGSATSTTKYANRIDVNTDNTLTKTFSTSLTYGIGYEVIENLTLDLFGSTSGDYIQIYEYKISATYKF